MHTSHFEGQWASLDRQRPSAGWKNGSSRDGRRLTAGPVHPLTYHHRRLPTYIPCRRVVDRFVMPSRTDLGPAADRVCAAARADSSVHFDVDVDVDPYRLHGSKSKGKEGRRHCQVSLYRSLRPLPPPFSRNMRVLLSQGLGWLVKPTSTSSFFTGGTPFRDCLKLAHLARPPFDDLDRSTPPGRPIGLPPFESLSTLFTSP
uniref:Uncharacterized protein n=1 Tax=Panagrellus redivivus TaxID=6233 RepID=A0A7E4VA13_PANRE